MSNILIKSIADDHKQKTLYPEGNLKPCPFCGNEAQVVIEAKTVFLICKGCGLKMSQEIVTYDCAIDRLCEKWQRRVSPADKKNLHDRIQEIARPEIERIRKEREKDND